jgi:hypothetical protein
MGEREPIVRYTITLVVVAAIWLLLSSGILPIAETSSLVRAAAIVLALGLALCLIPGMLLNTWIVRLSQRATPIRRGPLILAGIAIPLLIFLLFLMLIVGDVQFLARARELGVGAESTQWRLIRNVGTGLVWLAMVILNGLNVLSPRRSAPHQERPTG